MKNASRNKIAAALILAAIATPGMADTETSNLEVSATVDNTCAIGNGTLSFGTRTLSRDTASGTAGALNDIDADTGASISIICTNGASASITANEGLNSPDAATRRMKSGADNYLAYELFTDAGRSTVLNGLNAIAYTGTGLATTTTSIYGRIPGSALQAAVKGEYADTVNLTITYTP